MTPGRYPRYYKIIRHWPSQKKVQALTLISRRNFERILIIFYQAEHTYSLNIPQEAPIDL